VAAGRGFDGIKLGIAAPEVDHAICHRCGRLNADPIVDRGVFTSLESPFHCSLRGIESIKIAVPISGIKCAIGECRGSVHDVAGFEFPFESARGGIERIDVCVTAAEINGAIRDDWR
jgi:hypothetical protein